MIQKFTWSSSLAYTSKSWFPGTGSRLFVFASLSKCWVPETDSPLFDIASLSKSWVGETDSSSSEKLLCPEFETEFSSNELCDFVVGADETVDSCEVDPTFSGRPFLNVLPSEFGPWISSSSSVSRSMVVSPGCKWLWFTY